MLTEKLNLSDLQSAKVNPFSGLYIYAQHKRQQVIMMEEYGKTTPHVKFSTMHPGWADTPGITVVDYLLRAGPICAVVSNTENEDQKHVD